MVRNNPCIIELQTVRLEIGHLLLGSIIEVSSLLSIAVARLSASSSSRLRLLFPGAGHSGSTRSPFCAWPTIHHCGGHCQDRPGLMPGRSGPPDRERETADVYLSYIREWYQKSLFEKN